jgi:hypothetical protein
MSASRRLGDAFSLYDGAVALYNKNLGLVQDLQKQLNLDMADLALQGISSPPNTVGDEISNLLPPVFRNWSNFKSATSDLENVIKAVLDEKGRLSDAAEALKQQLDYLKKVAVALTQKSIPKVNSDGSVTLPPPPGAVGPTVEVSPKGNVRVRLGPVCFGWDC